MPSRLECDIVHRTLCGDDMEAALASLEGRWKMKILAHLLGGSTLRFSELERAISKISQKMLIQQLRALEQDGLVSRTVHPQVPPKVEYSLTDDGRSLSNVFLALLDWSETREERATRQRG